MATKTIDYPGAVSGTHELILADAYVSTSNAAHLRGATTGLHTLPPGTCWADDEGRAWVLQERLLVTIHSSPDDPDITANSYLTISEYGIGASIVDALQDLLSSLSDYYQSLLVYQGDLGETEVADLTRLGTLLYEWSESE